VRQPFIPALVVALAGCQWIAGIGEHESGGPCKTNADCPDGQSCTDQLVCGASATAGTSGAGGAGAGEAGGGKGGLGGAAGTGGVTGGRSGDAGTAGSAGSPTAGTGQGGVPPATGGVGGADPEAGTGGDLPRGGDAGDGGSSNACPRVDLVEASPSEGTVGGNPLQLTADVTDDGGPDPITYLWQTTSGNLDSTSSPATSFSCTVEGTVTITLQVSDGACQDEQSTQVACAEPQGPNVVINEVEAESTSLADWVELFNAGGSVADLSGFALKDSSDSNTYGLPNGTTLEAGEYLLIDESTLEYGLGLADSVRLFDAGGTIVDSYTWTAYPTATFGRCPNGTGSLTTTKSATPMAGNDCPDVGTDVWPGSDAVNVADDEDVFGENLSGLTYEVTSTVDVLWAARNRPGAIFRLLHDQGSDRWIPDTASGWSDGKLVHYADGSGNVDAEGLTRAELSSTTLYLATERDNSALTVSRPSILLVDFSGSGTELDATQEWNLVADLPVVDPNLGLEAITWVPDSFLVDPNHHFYDENKGAPYDPAQYSNHGTGLFFVGLEVNGTIYAYALDHTNVTYQRVATIASGQPTIMSLEFERDRGLLWAGCDDSCNGQTNVLEISTDSVNAGRFQVTHEFARPVGMSNLVNEGFALAPESTCQAGEKAAFWADDANANRHSLHSGTVQCGSL
jgi:hypothetical protein